MQRYIYNEKGFLFSYDGLINLLKLLSLTFEEKYAPRKLKLIYIYRLCCYFIMESVRYFKSQVSSRCFTLNLFIFIQVYSSNIPICRHSATHWAGLYGKLLYSNHLEMFVIANFMNI